MTGWLARGWCAPAMSESHSLAPSEVPDRPPAGAPPPPSPASQGSIRWRRVLYEVIHDVTFAALVAIVVITFVAQPFHVKGQSMAPLLEDGERILVDKLVYRYQPIARGDVVVFWDPSDPSWSFIKRVIAKPGELVEIRDGRVYVNGAALREDYVLPGFKKHENIEPVEVPKGYYYVLGDHRSDSSDSRTWGGVPQKYIYGRAAARFWPPSHLGLIR